MMIRYARLVAAAAAALGFSPAMSQTSPPVQAVQASEPLKARAQEVIAILQGAGDYEATFAPAFLAQVPKGKFDEVSAQLAKSLGPVQKIEAIAPVSPYKAMLTVGYRDGTASMAISVAETPPHRVDGLLVTGTNGREASIGAVVDTLKSLPGSTGFALAKLTGSGPQWLAAHNPDQPLAIGSAFKLVILAELVRATNAGERKWSDTVAVDGSQLPGGAYIQAAKGTSISLDELAGKMISVSDNSATDILLRHLGREPVEAMVGKVGVRDPRGMRPFLSALEVFKLKGIKGAVAERYLAADEAGRRALLDKEVAAQPISAISPTLFRDGKPVMIDKLEWFASASDLVRTMDWLRRNSEGNPTARAILSKNPGVGPAAAGKWRYVGFKGGSEPGVINMTLLLESSGGEWFALASSWNDVDAEVDGARFAGLVGRAAELAAQP